MAAKKKRRDNPDVGSLSATSKTPGYSWGISPSMCKTGARLAKISGSVCSKCYAKRGNYGFPSVVNCHAVRLERYIHSPSLWKAAMVELLQGEAFFRWFDSGDLQHEGMLESILDVAEATPDVKHWVNTREVRMVRGVLKRRHVPANVNIKLSAPLFNVNPASVPGCTGAMVHTSQACREAYECQAPSNGGSFGECRACWDKSVKLVSFKVH